MKKSRLVLSLLLYSQTFSRLLFIVLILLYLAGAFFSLSPSALGFHYELYSLALYIFLLIFLVVQLRLDFKIFRFQKIQRTPLFFFILTTLIFTLLTGALSWWFYIPLWRDEFAQINLSLQSSPFLACAQQSQPPFICGLTSFLFLTPLNNEFLLRIFSLVSVAGLLTSLFALLLRLSRNYIVALVLVLIFSTLPAFSESVFQNRPVGLGLWAACCLLGDIFILRRLNLKRRRGAIVAVSSLILLLSVGFQSAILCLTLFFCFFLLDLYSGMKNLRWIWVSQLIAVAIYLPLFFGAYQLSSVVKYAIIDPLTKGLFNFSWLELLHFSLNGLEFWSALSLLIFLVHQAVSREFKNFKFVLLALPTSYLFVFTGVYNLFISVAPSPRYILIYWLLIVAGFAIGFARFKKFKILRIILVVPTLLFWFFDIQKGFENRPHLSTKANYLDFFESIPETILISQPWFVVCYPTDEVICFSQHESFFALSTINKLFDKKIIRSSDAEFLQFFKWLKASSETDVQSVNLIFEANYFTADLIKMNQNLIPGDLFLSSGLSSIKMTGTKKDLIRKWDQILNHLIEQNPERFSKLSIPYQEYLLHFELLKTAGLTEDVENLAFEKFKKKVVSDLRTKITRRPLKAD